MKTTLDFADIICNYLSDTAIKTAITGSICKKRPINSTKEDVVVNTLAVNNLQLQEAIVNVNIHVPNRMHRINDIQDNTQPDTMRLKQLATLAVGLLAEQWQPGEDYHFDVQQQNLFEDEAGNSHYINIRLNFYSINLLN